MGLGPPFSECQCGGVPIASFAADVGAESGGDEPGQLGPVDGQGYVLHVGIGGQSRRLGTIQHRPHKVRRREGPADDARRKVASSALY
ncbi:hypothetical protein NMT55_24555, partial [Escherichia coli]|nr:hypothetical protein [Escherichia coli]